MNDPDDLRHNITGGMKFEVVEDSITNELVGCILTSRNNDAPLPFDSNLLKLVVSLEEVLRECGKLHILAEHTRHGVIFCAHPNF